MANVITTLLKLDATQLRTGLRGAQQTIQETDGIVNKAKAGWASMWSSFTSSPVAIAGATAAVGAFTAKAIDDASALEESVNAVNVAYQDSAAGVHALGEVSAESFGLSQRAFNEFSVQFSAFASKVAEAGGRDVVGVLDEMTTRIADFASVNNLDMAEAAQIFQSSLAGETEALRRFGGDVSAAAVEQFALETGLIRTKSELTESIKVQARYGLLMRETAKTAGDFANTSGSLANQQRILRANMENLSASFGQRLTPVIADAAATVNNLISAYNDLVDLAPAGGGSGPVGRFVEGLTSPFAGLGAAMDLAEKATGKLDDALGDQDKQLVENIKSWREATEQANQWTSAHVPATRATENHADRVAASSTQMELYVESLEQSAAAVNRQREADERAATEAEKRSAILENQREVTEALAAAEERRLDIVNRSLGGALRLAQTQRDARDSLHRYNEQVEEHNKAADEFKLNEDQMADLVEETALSQLEAAEAAAQYRIEQAEATGATVTAADQQRILIEELFKLAGTLSGPVQRAVIDATTALDNLARDRFFTVQGNVVLNQPGREGDFALPEVGGIGGRTINVTINTTGELAPEKVVEAIRKYDRLNIRS